MGLEQSSPPLSITPGSFLDNVIQTALTRGGKFRAGLASGLGYGEKDLEAEKFLGNEIYRMITGIDRVTGSRDLPEIFGAGVTAGSRLSNKKWLNDYDPEPTIPAEHTPSRLSDLELYKEIDAEFPNLPEERKFDASGWRRDPLSGELVTYYPDAPTSKFPSSPSSSPLTPKRLQEFENLPPGDPNIGFKPTVYGYQEDVAPHPTFSDFPSSTAPLTSPDKVIFRHQLPDPNNVGIKEQPQGYTNYTDNEIGVIADSPKDQREVYAHETSHLAASQSNLPVGTSPELVPEPKVKEFKKKYPKLTDAEARVLAYLNEAGEIRARNDSRFSHLTPDEYRMGAPYNIFDKDPLHFSDPWISKLKPKKSEATKIRYAKVSDVPGGYTEVLENPTYNELLDLAKQAEKDYKDRWDMKGAGNNEKVRWIKDYDGNILAWPATRGMHSDIKRELKTPNKEGRGFWNKDEGFEASKPKKSKSTNLR